MGVLPQALSDDDDLAAGLVDGDRGPQSGGSGAYHQHVGDVCAVHARSSLILSWPRTLNSLLPHDGLPGIAGRLQPERDVFGLHGISNHGHEVVAEDIKVGFVAEPFAEGFERPSGVVLPPVEAAVYEALDAPAQWVEQGRDRESGDDHCELWLLLLAGNGVGRTAWLATTPPK